MKKQLNITGILSILSFIGITQLFWYIGSFYTKDNESKLSFVIGLWFITFAALIISPGILFLVNKILFCDEERQEGYKDGTRDIIEQIHSPEPPRRRSSRLKMM